MSDNEKDTSRMFRTYTVTRRAHFAAAALPYYLAKYEWGAEPIEPTRDTAEARAEWAADMAYMAADKMMNVSELWDDWDEGSDE